MTSYCIIGPLGSNYSRLPGKMFRKIKQGKGNELLSLDRVQTAKGIAVVGEKRK